MKRIKLTQGKHALVDDEDYERVSQWKWHFGDTGYAINRSKQNGRSVTIRMHRLILNTKKNEVADHINGNPLDNRRSNLRIVSALENHWNQKKRPSKSKYKGVGWWSVRNIWRVRLTYKKKEIWIGYFKDEIEGALAYNQAAKKYFGEFARLNIIKP